MGKALQDATLKMDGPDCTPFMEGKVQALLGKRHLPI